MVELACNMVVMTLLIVGMASSIKLASLSAPHIQNPNSAALSATDAMEMLTNDLRYAQSVVSQTATQITITIPDRDGQSPSTETITYSWSGTAGAPLVRTFNGTSANIATDVHEFLLVGHTRSLALPVTYSDSPEVQLTSFTTGATTTDWGVATKNWIGEYVQPNLPSAVSWKITQVKFNAKQNGTTTGTALVQVRTATGSGLPTTTVLASQTLLESSLATGYTQRSFTMTGVPDTAVGTGLCLVVRFSANSPSCFVQYLNSGASTGNNKFLSTTNSDAGWAVGAGKAMLFEVWGTYKTQNAQAYQYFLQDIRCALKTGTSALGKVEKVVRVLNEPQVAGP